MANVTEAAYASKHWKAGIVISRFNEYVTKMLLEGSLNELRRSGISDADIEVVWVPGAHEIPLACQTLAQAKKVNLLVAIGCIVRGETSHYEHLAQAVTDGIQKVCLEQALPVGLGVLTVESMAQAIDRSGAKHGNKGRDAAQSALEMAEIISQLKDKHEKEEHLKHHIEQQLK